MFKLGRKKNPDGDNTPEPQVISDGNVEATITPDAEPAPGAPAPTAPRKVVNANTIAEIELVGETVVATLTVTELCDDTGAVRLADLLYELGQVGARHFVLDIQNVQFMDSACLGCLVEALNMMAQNGGKIALANAAQGVESLFRLTRLDRVFPICKDVVGALNAVEGKPRDAVV